MALLDLVVSAYGPWLLVFFLHGWLFQSIDDDRENAARRMQLDVNNYIRGHEGADDLVRRAKDVHSKTIQLINQCVTVCHRTFFAQLLLVGFGIVLVVGLSESVPALVIGSLIALVFVVMVLLFRKAVNSRRYIREASLGF